MISLLQIDYFLEVAEQMSITAAAKKLYISQPALSKHISFMEQELGVKLFERTARKITMTPAGDQLYRDLMDVRRRLDKALENAAMAGKKNIVPIKIGCFDGRVTDDYLPEVIRKLHDYNPELSTLLGMYTLDELMWRLYEGIVDIAFTLEADYVPNSGYITRRVFRRRSAIIYSDALFGNEKNKRDILDFYDKDLLIPKIVKGHMLGRNNLIRAAELGLNAENYIENDNMETILMNLKLGAGYTILSADIAGHGNGLKAIELGPEYNAWIIGIVKKDNKRALKVFDDVFNSEIY